MLARLEHPAVVRILDVHEHEGEPFIVMELVNGPTLAQRLAEGPLDVDTAKAITVDVAEGLAHRPRARRRAPGPQARQPRARPGRADPHRGLRHRPDHRRHPPDPGGGGRGHRGLPRARAGPGRRDRPPRRHLHAGPGPAGGPDRAATVRGHRHRDRGARWRAPPTSPRTSRPPGPACSRP